MSGRSDITRAEVGPHTDVKVAAMALVSDMLKRETAELAALIVGINNWETGLTDRAFITRHVSLKAARRSEHKARRRVEAATRLYEMMSADVAGRLHILRDITAGSESTLVASTGVGASELAKEPYSPVA